jgi:hypothetical protein
MIISLWSILPASADTAKSEALVEEKIESGFTKMLTTKSGGRFLPIPIFITEPAIGYGLGVAVGYIHPEKNKDAKDRTPTQHSLESIAEGSGTGQKPPPTITGVAGGYTEKGTWAVGVGHSTSWRKDTIRFAGALVYMDVNSDYWVLEQPLSFNLRGTGLYSDIKFRLGRSPWFLGGKLGILDSETDFDTPRKRQGDVILDNIEPLNVGLAASVTFDKRDNVFTPNTGQLLQFDLWRFDESFGGNYNYWKGKAKVLSFHQLHEKFVLGLRVEASALDGFAPLYAYPWVKLRGIPALRYQGKGAGEVEAELRWNFLPRWALLGFAGVGAVYRDSPLEDRLEDDLYAAGGIGARYFMFQDLGLWLGVDVARGSEDWYTYITVGQAW